jgi:hypothetical protein
MKTAEAQCQKKGQVRCFTWCGFKIKSWLAAVDMELPMASA